MPDNDTEILQEMLKWLRFSGMQEAKSVIDEALTFEEDEEKEKDARIAFELTNGDKSQREISEYISYSGVTVGNWQKKWAKLGIVSQDDDGKYEQLISLKDLGLEVPDIPDPEDAEEPE